MIRRMINPALGGVVSHTRAAAARGLGPSLFMLAMIGCSDDSSTASGGGASGGGGAGTGAVGGDGGGGGDGAGGSGAAAAGYFGLNDVSVLFPLPTSQGSPDVLRLDSEGNGGPLFAGERYGAIPEFQTPTAIDYATWIIVSVRIDPCFPDLRNLEEDPSLCRRQLRLVAQPYAPSLDTQLLVAHDHALHLLYDFTADEFDDVMAAWTLAKPEGSSNPQEKLGVHPVLLEEGLAGPFGTTIRELILTFAGDATLSQFTFMRGAGVVWDFGGFKVDGDGQVPIQIHDLQPASDRVAFSITSESEPFTVSPSSPEIDALLALAGEKVNDELVLTASFSEIKDAFQMSLDLENPTRFNPDTTDCASCHFASRARERAVALGESPGGLENFDDPTFNLALGIPSEEQRNLLQQRGFGWNGTVPMFMQRTLNESAAVANTLNALIAAGP